MKAVESASAAIIAEPAGMRFHRPGWSPPRWGAPALGILPTQSGATGKFKGEPLGAGENAIQPTHKEFEARVVIVPDLDADGQVETCTEYYDRLIMPNGARTPYADDPRRSAIGLAVGVRQHVMASGLREQRRLPLGIELDGAVSIGCRPDQALFHGHDPSNRFAIS